MLIKKIEIKNEEHYNEVIKALESMGEKMGGFIDDITESRTIKSLWYNDTVSKWYFSVNSIYSDFWVLCKDVPEYEIVSRTSYELKEVPKLKITCKCCGKVCEYKHEKDIFKDFVVFQGKIYQRDMFLYYETSVYICKNCLKRFFN